VKWVFLLENPMILFFTYLLLITLIVAFFRGTK
jgi:phosphate starvation-inducible membrane PsiE